MEYLKKLLPRSAAKLKRLQFPIPLYKNSTLGTAPEQMGEQMAVHKDSQVLQCLKSSGLPYFVKAF